MTTTRFGESGVGGRLRGPVCLASLLALLAAVPCPAQSTGAVPTESPDPTAAAPSDPAAPKAAGPVSPVPDTAAVAPGDTLSRPGPDSSTPPARPAPPPAPVDSALRAACTDAGGPPDLLLVKFRPSTTADEREAVAGEVGGTLIGTSEHAAPGAWYLRVPGSAADRSVADRLILLSPVLEVGTTRCPA